jgi:hypothetical protein
MNLDSKLCFFFKYQQPACSNMLLIDIYKLGTIQVFQIWRNLYSERTSTLKKKQSLLSRFIYTYYIV